MTLKKRYFCVCFCPGRSWFSQQFTSRDQVWRGQLCQGNMAAEICLRLCSPEISWVGVQAQSWWFVCCHTQPGSEPASGKWQQTVASAALQSGGRRWVKQVSTRAISNQNGHFWQNDILKIVKHFQMIRFEATFCWCACSHCYLHLLTTDPHKHCFLLLAYTSTSKIFWNWSFSPRFSFSAKSQTASMEIIMFSGDRFFLQCLHSQAITDLLKDLLLNLRKRSHYAVVVHTPSEEGEYSDPVS